MSDKLEILKNLVNITDEELKGIYNNVDNNYDNIQLLDYIDQIDLGYDEIKKLKESMEEQVTEDRIKYLNKFRSIINATRTLDHNLSELRINPYTEFENEPTLFFGVGGGSKALCKGLPFDVLVMVLTGEKIRRELNINRCTILLANRITYTNIPRNSEFSKESIDNVMETEREILELVIEKFGLHEHWNVVLQTELEDYIGQEQMEEYESLVDEGDKSKIVGGHHYAIEMADINALVGQNSGGIKLGWFIRNIDTVNGGYIMDEQPFHARYVLFMAKENIRNKVSLAYALAGARIYGGPNGELEKSSPYICYQPDNRILLSPYEDIIEKMRMATEEGFGFEYKYLRNFFSGIVDLFENLVLGKDSNGRVRRIKTYKEQEYRGMNIAEKMQFILDYIYYGREEEMKEVWLNGFSYTGEDVPKTKKKILDRDNSNVQNSL